MMSWQVGNKMLQGMVWAWGLRLGNKSHLGMQLQFLLSKYTQEGMD